MEQSCKHRIAFPAPDSISTHLILLTSSLPRSCPRHATYQASGFDILTVGKAANSRATCLRLARACSTPHHLLQDCIPYFLSLCDHEISIQHFEIEEKRFLLESKKFEEL